MKDATGSQVLPARKVSWLASVLGCWVVMASAHSSARPTLQFTAASYSVNEAAETVTLSVRRLNDLSTTVSVDYATADGSATNGLKYISVTGVLAFGVGETNQIIVVPILNDGFADGTKTFRVVLSHPNGGAVLGARTNALVSIADNDSGVQFRFANYTNAEDVGAARIGVVRCDDGENPVTGDYATSDLTATGGVDYSGVTNTLAFGPNEPLKFFTVPILNNSLKQANRMFRVTLSNPTGATLGGTRMTTVTIIDNDQGFQFDSADYTVTEDAGAVLINLLRGTDETNCLATVDLATTDLTATAGSDYTGTTNTLVFAPGESVKRLVIPILNDGLRESTVWVSDLYIGALAFILLPWPWLEPALGLVRCRPSVVFQSRRSGAHYHAQTWNASEIANSLGINCKTAQHYLESERVGPIRVD